MKRIIAGFMSVVMMLTGCGKTVDTADESVSEKGGNTAVTEAADEKYIESLELTGISDPELRQYMNDAVYSELEEIFAGDDYIVDDISSVYISKEYIEELEYNTQANIFWGHTLSELDAVFDGTRYVFTMDEQGKSAVVPFEEYDDSYEEVLKNVAVGGGVILFCVTVSMVSGALGAPSVVTMFFAASASSATKCALSSGLVSGISAGLITGLETGDFDEALKAAVVEGSESFKCSAISGAVAGGVKSIYLMTGADKPVTKIPTPRQSELNVLKKYGGEEQVSYLNGKKVSAGTLGATRPDIVTQIGGHTEAIEGKNYNLEKNLSRLCEKLKKQVSDRVENLPAEVSQRIVLDISGRDYSPEVLENAAEKIHQALDGIYPDIPIDFFTA